MEADDSERGFWVVFGGLLLLTCVPPLLPRFLPMVDLPGHLAVVRILRDLGDPASPMQRLFAKRGGFTPYLGFYGFVEALAPMLGLVGAARAWVVAYALAVPLSLLALARAFGRSRWIALFGFPMTWSFTFFLGFAPYLGAVPLSLAALAAHAAWLEGRFAKAWGACAAMALLPLATLATHAQPFAFFCAGWVVLAALLGDRRRRLVSAACVAPSAALLLLWLLPAWRGGDAGATTSIGWDPLGAKLSGIGWWLIDTFRDPGARMALGAWAVLVAALGALAARDRIALRPRRDLAALLLFLGALVGFLVMPLSILRGGLLDLFLYQRFAIVAALLLPIAIPSLPGRVPRTLVAMLALLAATDAIYVADGFHRFDREVGSFDSLLAAAEPQSCVASLSGYFGSDVLHHRWNFSQLGQYFTVERDDAPGFPFAGTPQAPIRLRRADGTPIDGTDGALLPFVFPPNQERLVQSGQLYATYGHFWRYFLVPRPVPIASLFGPDAGRLREVADGGPFILWLNSAGTCGR